MYLNFNTMVFIVYVFYLLRPGVVTGMSVILRYTKIAQKDGIFDKLLLTA